MKNNLIDVLTKEIFKLEESYPVYRLIDGGERISVELEKDKFKFFIAQHMGPDGVLCNDLETFIKWEMFS